MTSHRAAVLAAVDALENAWRLVKPGWHIRDRFAALREVASRIPDPGRNLPFRAQPIAVGEEPRVPRAHNVFTAQPVADPDAAYRAPEVAAAMIALTLPCPQCRADADRAHVEQYGRCYDCALASNLEPVPASVSVAVPSPALAPATPPADDAGGVADRNGPEVGTGAVQGGGA